MSLFGDEVKPSKNSEVSVNKPDPNSSYLLISIGDLVPNKFQPRNIPINKKKWFNTTDCGQARKKR